MYYNILCCVCVCVIVVNFSEAHYTRQWAVHVEGGPQVADEVANDHGFDNHGQVRKMSFFPNLRHFGPIMVALPFRYDLSF